MKNDWPTAIFFMFIGFPVLFFIVELFTSIVSLIVNNAFVIVAIFAFFASLIGLAAWLLQLRENASGSYNDDFVSVKTQDDLHRQVNCNPYAFKDKRKADLTEFFNLHRNAVLSHWHGKRITDEYGQTDDTKWVSEADRFLSLFYREYNYISPKYSNAAIGSDVKLLNEIVADDILMSLSRTKNTRNLTGAASESVFSEKSASNAWDFERLCSEELERLGWITRIPTGGADQGVDVEAILGGRKLVVQCKLYGKAVGNKAVQEAISGRAFSKADFAAVVAPNGFTRSAQELAMKTNVLLLSPIDLANINVRLGLV